MPGLCKSAKRDADNRFQWKQEVLKIGRGRKSAAASKVAKEVRIEAWALAKLHEQVRAFQEIIFTEIAASILSSPFLN